MSPREVRRCGVGRSERVGNLLVAGSSVDGFAQQVHVAEVAGILRDEVGENPAEVGPIALTQPLHRGGEVGPRGGVGAGGDELGAVGRDICGRRRRVDIVEVARLDWLACSSSRGRPARRGV